MIYTRYILFFILNFGALAVGGIYTGKGVPSEWYMNLAKAPWTPPGWVFGAAWTSIMICFTFYMGDIWSITENKKMLIILFILQWILNVVWNPTFFYYHKVLTSLLLISALTALIGYMLYNYWDVLKLRSLLLAPYFVWLLIATSLNAYIYFKN